MEIEVRGAEQLAAVSRRLRAAGSQGKGLRKELLAAIQRSTKQTKEDVKENWRQKAPHRGGLSSRPLRLATRTRSGGQRVGVRIVSASGDGYNLGSFDRGVVRHPVYGNKGVWAVTKIQPGIITEPQEASAPDVREQIVRAIDAINRKVEGT
jgi:hypothetical protein